MCSTHIQTQCKMFYLYFFRFLITYLELKRIIIIIIIYKICLYLCTQCKMFYLYLRYFLFFFDNISKKFQMKKIINKDLFLISKKKVFFHLLPLPDLPYLPRLHLPFHLAIFSLTLLRVCNTCVFPRQRIE